jgi:hypothetical protein
MHAQEAPKTTNIQYGPPGLLLAEIPELKQRTARLVSVGASGGVSWENQTISLKHELQRIFDDLCRRYPDIAPEWPLCIVNVLWRHAKTFRMTEEEQRRNERAERNYWRREARRLKDEEG